MVHTTDNTSAGFAGLRRSLVVGAFDDRLEAERALQELKDTNFPADDLGFALRGSDVNFGGMATDAVGTKDAHGAVTGAAAGATVGGLLGAAAALLIPGVGPILAAGIITTSLGFAGAGAAIGGMLGAMQGLGASEHEAAFYEREFDAGKALVFVRIRDLAPLESTTANEELATQIIRKHGGRDLHRHNMLTEKADEPAGATLPEAAAGGLA